MNACLSTPPVPSKVSISGLNTGKPSQLTLVLVHHQFRLMLVSISGLNTGNCQQ